MTTAGGAALQSELDALSERILKVRALREHHVWEAAKALSLGRDLRFAALMEADALVDAVLLMAMRSEPRRTLAGIRANPTGWVCAMRCESGGADSRFKARHSDLAAALLGALLQSYRHHRDGKEPDDR